MKSILWFAVVSIFVVVIASEESQDVKYMDYNEVELTETSKQFLQSRNTLWDNVQNIFSKITNFFGFPSFAINREYREPPIVRRPEMLPMEMVYSKNRRNGQLLRQGPLKRMSDKNIRLERPFNFNKRLRPTPFEHRRKKVEPNYSSYHHNPEERFSDTDDRSMAAPITGKKYQRTSFKVVHLPSDGINPAIPPTKSDPKNNQNLHSEAIIRSREPVVAVYSNKGTHKSTMKTKQRPVHSKYALNNYGDKKKKLGNTFTKNPPTSPNNYDAFLVSSSFSHNPRKNQQQTDTISQNPKYHKSNLVKRPTIPKQSYSNDPYQTRDESIRPFFLTPPRQPVLPKRRKTLLDSMTGLASNIFQRFFPRRQPPTTNRRVRTVIDKSVHPRNRNRGHYPRSVQRPYHLHASASQNFPTLTSNDFSASPKEGSIAANAFQPILIPSPSLDATLSPDAMKPMFLVEKREAQIKTSGPTKPEIMDFFQ